MASMSSSDELRTQNPTVPQARRKFSKPPVKLACLSCRSLRTRCDGKDQCSNCVSRGTSCCYTPSKRGGPRVYKRKSKAVTEIRNEPGDGKGTRSDRENQEMGNVDLNWDEDTWFNKLVGLSDPGAGLRNVEMPISEIESLFDSIFLPQKEKPTEEVTVPRPPTVQTYGSDQDTLDAYYVFIHPYLPILPPPERFPIINRPLDPNQSSEFEPSSPLSLAVSAILALIPHAQEYDSSRLDSVRLRRDYAQAFAQSALESIEVDSELLASATNPANALADGAPEYERAPFHPKVPINLESVLALVLLSVYEYAQRGNMVKMRTRAGQALTSAMSISLHDDSIFENDGFSEARRRAWWMTYACVCQGSIVSNTPPIFDMHDPRFLTPYPTFGSDSEGWTFFIRAQQTILAATNFVHDLDKALKSWSDLSWLPQRMTQLDGQIEMLLSMKGQKSFRSLTGTTPVDASEAIVAKSMRSIAEIKLHSARIKTHRFCAFSDVPIFMKRHCDLGATATRHCPASASSNGEDSNSSISSKRSSSMSEQPQQVACSCHSFYGSHVPSGPNSPPLMPSPSDHSSNSLTPFDLGIRFPFSAHASSKICLHSALKIASLLDNLPYPNPSPTPNDLTSPLSTSFTTPPQLSRTHEIEVPRTMPTFACCAVQSSYAMLMLCFKTRTLHENNNSESSASIAIDGELRGSAVGGKDTLLRGFLDDLYQSLNLVVKSLSNYSIAFEALQGMRDEIQHAIENFFE